MSVNPKVWQARHAATASKLKREVLQRKMAEKKLKATKKHYENIVKEMLNKQKHMRDLSREILVAQEEDRKKISRELHDEIAQNLSGINVYLATLKVAASDNAKSINKKISHAERLVEKSVDKVHRFARHLRPTLLDDLGLIPALRSYVKSFTDRTRLSVELKAFHGAEQLSNAKKTVLYRVAQSALTNSAQHAKASLITVSIRRDKGFIEMKISDNGKSFNVERVLFANKKKRLGFLGMRERVEMVGGEFTVDSVKGTGTTIGVLIPLNGKRSKSIS